ncbi:hypothetical protein ACH42_00175 [Endozoicomonas sp. (ex Bugula neritina AB1)]|nr:hypothetical protein ACH42_00175 [Endozoicomonas sp. (ex Bugula neritina AB1)]
MNVMLASIGALGCYLMGAIGQGIRNSGRNLPRRGIQLLTLVGLIFHISALYLSIHIDQGVNLGVFTIASLTTMMVTLTVLLSSLKKPSDGLLVLILPVSMITVAAAWLTPIEHIMNRMDTNVVVHLLVSILAYGMLMVAAFQSLLVSYQETQLRKHKKTVKTLPPLQTMEKLLFEFLFIGVLLLTISLITGFLFFDDMFAHGLLHKTILSISAWCLFTMLLVGHWRFGWRGKTATRWTMSGFVVLILAYFGWRLVLQFVIRY